MIECEAVFIGEQLLPTHQWRKDMFRILVQFGVCVVVLTMGVTLGVNSLLAAEEEVLQEEQSFIIGEYFVCDVTR
ncbi:uncharacterized protein METZ01_LOCUS109466, partial [marine metagenome]